MFWNVLPFSFIICRIYLVESVPDVIKAACERDADLPYCKISGEERKRNEDRRLLFSRLAGMANQGSVNGANGRRVHDAPLAEEDRALLIQIARAVERFKRDPFSDIEHEIAAKKTPASKSSHSDSDLREKETADSEDKIEEEGFIAESHANRKLKEKEAAVHEEEETDESHAPRQTAEETDEVPTTVDRFEKYCDQYEQHFSFYCVGEIDQSGQHETTISKFCPSYKKACHHKQIASSVSLTAWPSNPFTKKITFRAPVAESTDEDSDESIEITSEEEREEMTTAYLKELKRRFPCKPDCDKRIFPHCTEECKCDYIYPAVQRFCNPPPLPLFLNTCRLWYNGCPKYAQYHYASQYIYSKAEKGKRVPGPFSSDPNPYNIPSPSGVPAVGGTGVAAGLPTQQQIYSDNPQHLRPVAHSSSTLVAPPPLPGPSTSTSAKRTKVKKNRRKQKPKTVHATMTTRDLYRSLRAINGLTAEPIGAVSDPTSLVSGSQANNKNGRKARAHQVHTFPVVPSDAVLAHDSTFKQFDGLTDSAGVLRRPRSRSPFSRPGLWEPNPDNPHNRDQSNKYFYYPKSVSADWLSGQLAWGAHWAVPAAGVGGTDGFSTVHFPTIGTFLNIPDDYD